jgi:hypothetical protein
MAAFLKVPIHFSGDGSDFLNLNACLSTVFELPDAINAFVETPESSVAKQNRAKEHQPGVAWHQQQLSLTNFPQQFRFISSRAQPAASLRIRVKCSPSHPIPASSLARHPLTESIISSKSGASDVCAQTLR